MSRPEIISASRRTDIPAFHARWFLRRAQAGWCHWIHPYTAQVHRVSLRPEDVIAIVFWTRNPGPLLPFLPGLVERGYPMLFQFTITGFGPPLETHNSPMARALARFERLAARLGPRALLWRYDPIVLTPEMTPAWHVERFQALCARLDGMTRQCTFSFVDFYGKTKRNLSRLEAEHGTEFHRPSPGEKAGLARELAAIASSHGMVLLSCCDDSLLGEGVGKSRCVDPGIVGEVRGEDVPPLPARPTRKDCGCVRSVDVGAYDTCAFGCVYCYATSGRGTALRRISEADPDDSVLWRPPSLREADLAALEVGG